MTDPRFDRASERYEPDESVSELFGKVASDIGALLSSEVELAKVELREEAQRLGRAAGMLTAEPKLRDHLPSSDSARACRLGRADRVGNPGHRW